MPPLTMLIKPASSNCNMRCQYCFYADVSHNREVPSYGMMSLGTLENIVQKALDYASGSCTIAFQGGEPTLIGLDFYRRLVEMVKQYNHKNLNIAYAIQTNGYVIDREWADFFAANKFLVGLSLDGNKDIHDSLRPDFQDKGTFSKVMHAAQVMTAAKVDFNILTVVTRQSARSINKIYNFYKRNGFLYHQYIPCLDPFGEERGGHGYSLTAEQYGQFLMTLFDLWYRDIKQGTLVSVRYFDNLILMLRGYPPESCGMLGHCTMQNVVEADGGVYPCDFYVIDKYLLGNLNEISFADIDANRVKTGFIQASQEVSPPCRGCKWAPLCRGGCRRDREPATGDKLVHNHFCKSYQMFFEYAIERLDEISRMRFPGE
ncbi:anaerobic sulfatase maturase [Ruminococcaceae bacterium OttesenSCG-928-L11]|nr:anaerobic sulfatase maturase [Ruminococcaceae bacterium OttesenSCG-928-L11]